MESEQNTIYGEEPLTWNFRSYSAFMHFHSQTHLILMDTMEKFHYSTFSEVIKFHDDFKNQDKSFEEFFRNYKSDPDLGLNCIGISLLLKRQILERLSGTFPFLDSHLYLCSSEHYLTKVLPERLKDGIPDGTGHFKRHAVLALKFSLESTRIGYVLYDQAFGIDIPVVVMEDGLPPHTGRFWLRGTDEFRFNHFRLQEGTGFVKWYVTKQKDQHYEEGSVFRWFYPGRKFINIDEMHTRNKVAYYHGIMVAGEEGFIGGVYKVFQDKDLFRFLTLEHPDDRSLTVTGVSFDYFLQEDYDESIERLLVRTADLCHIPLEELRELMTKFAKVFLDQDFVREWERKDGEMVDAVNRMIEQSD